MSLLPCFCLDMKKKTRSRCIIAVAVAAILCAQYSHWSSLSCTASHEHWMFVPADVG